MARPLGLRGRYHDRFAALLIIAILDLLNGLFVAAEFAIIGVRASRIEQFAERRQPAGQMGAWHPVKPYTTDRYVATAQLGITLASLGLGMYGEPYLAGPIEGRLHAGSAWREGAVHTAAFLIALTIITYLHVVFGEMVPKSIALHSAEHTVLALASPMRVASRLLSGPVTVLNHAGMQLLRLSPRPSRRPKAAASIRR